MIGDGEHEVENKGFVLMICLEILDEGVEFLLFGLGE